MDSYTKIQNMNGDDGEIKGSLKIGAPESLTVYRLECVLTEYRREFPNVDIILVNGTCGDIKEQVLLGELDIGFIAS
ncbi:MAG: LysR family transcriptional regulator substrate-binding protein [Bacillota bacterium]